MDAHGQGRLVEEAGLNVAGVDLTVFTARCGDRNPRGMAGAEVVGAALAERLSLTPVAVGAPEAPLAQGWDVELAAALPALRLLSRRYDEVLAAGAIPLTTMGRCAAGLATIPVVARRHPNAAVVWFDAHGDSNTPETTTTGYLGGLVLTGASGRWRTGLGDDLDLGNVVLVGARDFDPAERELIERGGIRLVPPGEGLAERLAAAVDGRRVYVHLDCDVLDPGIVPIECVAEGGLSLDDLRRAAEVLGRSGLVGLEIAEFEDRWADTLEAASPAPLLAALDPLIAGLG